jgi:N-hydroxyarylamine O-acetyltransferase
MSLDGRPVSPDLAARVLRRLGYPEHHDPNLAGLSALYRAWCAHVPFDNTRKMIALAGGAGRPLPGTSADDFFTSWLAHGTGGTCWPSSNALYAILRAAGFDARRVVGSMRDLGVLNHASVKVRLDAQDWLADSSMLTNAPLPLGEGVVVGDDPVWPVEVEATDGTHLVWWHTPPGTDCLPCRLLLDPASFGTYVDGYERSRARSPFNQRLYARRNLPGELIILIGRTRYSRTPDGVTMRDLSRKELRAALCEDIGLSAALVDEWAACGALEASFAPAAGPPPPTPVTGKPPSQR